MAQKVIMPKAGMAMEKGKIIKWLAKEGDKVERGEPLLEIETDKVNMEIEAQVSGTLLKIMSEEGETVPVTQTIGYIGKPGDEISEEPETAHKLEERRVEQKEVKENVPKLERSGRIPATPLAKMLAAQRKVDLSNVTPSGYFGEVKAKDVIAAKGIKATPLARKMAQQEGILLSDIDAKGHRIYSDDVKAVMDKAAEQQADVPEMMEGDTIKTLNGMRKTIAQRMLSSHIEIPPVTMDAKADVTGLLAERKRLNAKEPEKISINDFVIQACAQALSDMPGANISFAGNSVIYRKSVNIGVAVALDKGLIVPVIKNANKLSLKDISKSVKFLAAKSKSGKLMPDESMGGTFTVSNLGMYGITFFTPIINQPESMILGVCAIEKVLKMDEDRNLYNRDIMGLSLTFDHRVHDGASAAVFLKKIIEQLEKYNDQI